MVTQMTKDARVQLPISVVGELGLREGDKLACTVERGGIRLEPLERTSRPPVFPPPRFG